VIKNKIITGVKNEESNNLLDSDEEEIVIDIFGKPWVGHYEISKKVGRVRLVLK